MKFLTNDFIGPFKSAFKDKTITIYHLLISGLGSYHFLAHRGGGAVETG